MKGQKPIRNRKRKVKAQVIKTKPVVSLSDKVALQGLDHLKQSLFSGIAGIHRGITWGNQSTALCRFRRVFDISVKAGSTAVYAWSPTSLTSANAFTYAYSTTVNQTTPFNPFNTTGVANVTVGTNDGPFTSENPALEWRIVRAAMRITPTASLTNSSGYHLHAYAPCVYTGYPGAANLSAVPITPSAWTASVLENFAMWKTFAAQQQAMLQWFPDDDEVYVNTKAAYDNPTNSASGFIGILAGGSNDCSYHIELDYGIEYVPSIIYRPFVERSLPEVPPDATYYLTHLIQKDWDRLVLTTVQQYDQMTAAIDHLPSAWSTRYQQSNGIGMPSYSLPLVVEETKASNLCDNFERITGYDVCGGVSTGLKRVGNAMVDQLGRAYISGTAANPAIML